MAKKYASEVKEVLESTEDVKDQIDPKAETLLKEQVKKEAKAVKKTGVGLRV